MQFQIRGIEGSSELEACALLQAEAWGFDKLDVVSSSMLASCQRHGGVLLGAFEPAVTLIGFVFSLPALSGRTLHPALPHAGCPQPLQGSRGRGLAQNGTA